MEDDLQLAALLMVISHVTKTTWSIEQGSRTPEKSLWAKHIIGTPASCAAVLFSSGPRLFIMKKLIVILQWAWVVYYKGGNIDMAKSIKTATPSRP